MAIPSRARSGTLDRCSPSRRCSPATRGGLGRRRAALARQAAYPDRRRGSGLGPRAWAAVRPELQLGRPGALFRRDVEAVLKLGPPEPGHLAAEATALARYGGHGAVRLLAHDHVRGALLLERAVPGTMARAMVPERDLVATAAIITVMRRLHSAVPPSAGLPDLVERDRPSFVDHLRRYPGDTPFPRRLVVRAAGLLEELSASATDRVLLHGDLHHDNVLRAQREPWLAIDPHGVVGDPGVRGRGDALQPGPGAAGPGSDALWCRHGWSSSRTGWACHRTGWWRGDSCTPCSRKSGRPRRRVPRSPAPSTWPSRSSRGLRDFLSRW